MMDSFDTTQVLELVETYPYFFQLHHFQLYVDLVVCDSLLFDASPELKKCVLCQETVPVEVYNCKRLGGRHSSLQARPIVYEFFFVNLRLLILREDPEDFLCLLFALLRQLDLQDLLCYKIIDKLVNFHRVVESTYYYLRQTIFAESGLRLGNLPQKLDFIHSVFNFFIQVGIIFGFAFFVYHRGYDEMLVLNLLIIDFAGKVNF